MAGKSTFLIRIPKLIRPQRSSFDFETILKLKVNANGKGGDMKGYTK